jgi:hypothetical protein
VGRTVEEFLPLTDDRGFAPPGSDLGEEWVTRNGNPPTLVFGEMKMEHVALVQGDELDEPEQERLRHEVSANVEVHPPPWQTRRIDDLEVRNLDRARATRTAVHRGGQQLAKGLKPIKGACPTGGGNDDLPLACGQPVGLVSGRRRDQCLKALGKVFEITEP